MMDQLTAITSRLPAEDPVLIFAVLLLTLLLAPVTARRVRLPEIVGLIVAGILIGPNGIGVLERSATIELLGMVGLLYIMFEAGLEIDLEQVRSQRHHSVVFGLITFAIPLVLGTILGLTAFAMSIPVALLLASMFSSHTLVTFPILTKLGLSKSLAATTTIGGTIITDVLALLVLAVVAATAEGELSTLFWIRLFLLMVLYAAVVLYVTPKLGRRVLRETAIDENLQFVFVIATVFTAGWLAHLAGLEPIIGAFLVGLCLNRVIPGRSLLSKRIHFTGDAIFIPFFLISVGMLVDIRLLFADARTWLIAGGMIAVALISKAAAASSAGRILGYDRDERRLIYGLSVNQAAATLAAVLVGFNLALFDEAVVTGTIMMIAVTCFVGPIVTERAGRRVATAEAEREHEHRVAPRRILVAISDRHDARALFDMAFLLHPPAGAGSGDAIYPVSVATEGGDIERALLDSERLLAHAVARGIAAEVPVIPVASVDVNIAGGLIRAARENRTPLILASWDGASRGRSHTFGHTLDDLVERSNRTIIISRLQQTPASTSRIRILLPPLISREPGFDLAFATIRTLAGQAGATLIVHATGETIDHCATLFDAQNLRYDSWRAALDELPLQVKEDDWIFLMESRKGGIAWQPSLQRAPSRLIAALPSNNISFLYPASEDSRDDLEIRMAPSQMQGQQGLQQNGEQSTGGQSIFEERHSVRDADVENAAELLTTMFNRVDWENPELRDRLYSLLREMAGQEAVELTPGTVLLHAHVDELCERIVLLGSSRQPFELPGITSPVATIVILLNPAGTEAQQHLESLARIAREIRETHTRSTNTS